MKLQSNNGNVVGNYFYHKVSQEIKVSGTIEKDSTMTLNEFDKSGNLTGVFKGKRINADKIEGIWEKPDKSKNYSFVLINSGTSYNSHLDDAVDQKQQKQKNAETKNLQIEEKELRNNWYEFLSINTNRYSVDNLGGIYNLEIEVDNKSKYKIDLIEVDIMYNTINGYLFKSETLYLKDIQPNSLLTFNAPSSNRGSSVSVLTNQVVSKDLKLCYSPGNWANNSSDPYLCE